MIGDARLVRLEARLKLAELLCEAAELEHALLCKYLFAAFSLKHEDWEGGVTPKQLEMIRSWETTLFLIARQEMEHLALVCNLLTAIGEAPYLRRPNFPVSGRHYPLGIHCDLEPFGACAVQRFIEFEMPSHPDRQRLKDVGLTFNAQRHTTIGDLYREIETLFRELSGPGLFVGPPSAQLMTTPGVRGLTLASGRTYQVSLTSVTDEDSACQIIAQIIAEGEGTPGQEPNSHFARLCTIYSELQAESANDPGFHPARPVERDRTYETGGRDTSQAPPLTGAALELVELFDLAYETLMLLLIRFFAHSDQRPAEVNALQNVAFFPMMTAVIRPLGELMTESRAGLAATSAQGRGFVLIVSFLCCRIRAGPARRSTPICRCSR